MILTIKYFKSSIKSACIVFILGTLCCCNFNGHKRAEESHSFKKLSLGKNDSNGLESTDEKIGSPEQCRNFINRIINLFQSDNEDTDYLANAKRLSEYLKDYFDQKKPIEPFLEHYKIPSYSELAFWQLILWYAKLHNDKYKDVKDSGDNNIYSIIAGSILNYICEEANKSQAKGIIVDLDSSIQVYNKSKTGFEKRVVESLRQCISSLVEKHKFSVKDFNSL